MIDEKKLMAHIESQYREWGDDYDALQILGDIEDFPKVDVPDINVGEWIPCNKEMPTEKGYYQTTVFRNGNVGYEVFDLWWQDGMWFVDEGKEMFIHAVIAWQTLPPPYKESEG